MNVTWALFRVGRGAVPHDSMQGGVKTKAPGLLHKRYANTPTTYSLDMCRGRAQNSDRPPHHVCSIACPVRGLQGSMFAGR